MRQSAALLGRNKGPTHGHWERFWQQQQAHAWASAATLRRHSGPIRENEQYYLVAVMGPYETIGSISRKNSWPICDHQLYVLAAPMVPSDTIGNMSLEVHWGHSMLSAAFLMSDAGPIAHIRLLLSAALLLLGSAEATNDFCDIIVLVSLFY